jgi:GT2 family glycosyltransferase
MALNIVIGIPTIGRATVLRETLIGLTKQIRKADRIIVCGARACDVDGAEGIGGAEVILSTPGSSHQRNALIAAAPTADVIVFFDDDFMADIAYVAELERAMERFPAIVVATGRVLADGISGPGLTAADAMAILREVLPRPGITAVFSGYGCNMAVRATVVRAHGLLFDERLPLYAWQEDVDLSRRLAQFGSVVRVEAASGVHRGVKHGRGSGVRLGYSQVANPLYLAGKQAGYPLPRALEHIGRNLAMNIARAARPEPYIDRRGRLRGNLLALSDLMLRRMTPERALDL